MLVPAPRRRVAEQLLAGAKIKATWSPAPSADAIRARDEEMLVREITAMAETPAEEDLATGRTLLAKRTPEELAATLVRLRRELLPAPEVLDDSASFQSEVRPHGNGFKSTRGRFERAGKRNKGRWKGNRH